MRIPFEKRKLKIFDEKKNSHRNVGNNLINNRTQINRKVWETIRYIFRFNFKTRRVSILISLNLSIRCTLQEGEKGEKFFAETFFSSIGKFKTRKKIIYYYCALIRQIKFLCIMQFVKLLSFCEKTKTRILRPLDMFL